jgi:hypothetical protein
LPSEVVRAFDLVIEARLPLIFPVARVFVDDEVLAFFAMGIDTLAGAIDSAVAFLFSLMIFDATDWSSSSSESDALSSSDSSDSLEFHFEASK